MLMKVAFQRLLGVLAFAFLVLNVVLKLLLLAAMQRTRDHDRGENATTISTLVLELTFST